MFGTFNVTNVNDKTNARSPISTVSLTLLLLVVSRYAKYRISTNGPHLIIQMTSNAHYSLLCTFAFRVAILKQPGMTFKYAIMPNFIADYQIDVRLTNLHNIYHLHLLPNVYVTICLFHGF